MLISDDTPLDEPRRDDLIEHFQVTYQPAGGCQASEDDDEDDEEDDDGWMSMSWRPSWTERAACAARNSRARTMCSTGVPCDSPRA